MSNKKNNGFTLNEQSSSFRSLGVGTASMLDTQTAGAQTDNENGNKTRRRSALIEEGQPKELKKVGYEQRNLRLNDLEGIGQDLPDDLDRRNEFNKLLAKGVYLLGMREHSVQEINKKLNAKSESADIVLAVIDELLENDYLSDERFAESYVRSRMSRGFGPIKIKAELKSKGINSTLIGDHLDIGSSHWFDVARELYEKKYISAKAQDYKEWTKRARFIQSRGFTMEHIQAVMPSADFY